MNLALYVTQQLPSGPNSLLASVEQVFHAYLYMALPDGFDWPSKSSPNGAQQHVSFVDFIVSIMRGKTNRSPSINAGRGHERLVWKLMQSFISFLNAV